MERGLEMVGSGSTEGDVGGEAVELDNMTVRSPPSRKPATHT